MTVEVAAPQDKMGDISGDLSTRRGRITDTRSEADGSLTITAQVPLAELEDYQSRLKSMTGGEGSFTMELAGYEPVPANIQQQIVAAYKPHEES
jgi:elongation factor G